MNVVDMRISLLWFHSASFNTVHDLNVNRWNWTRTRDGWLRNSFVRVSPWWKSTQVSKWMNYDEFSYLNNFTWLHVVQTVEGAERKQGNSKEISLHFVVCACFKLQTHSNIILWWWWINICRRERAYLLLYSLHRQLSPEHKQFFRFHFTVCLLFAYCARRISIALPTTLACARIPKCRCSFLLSICINMICLGRNFAIKQCANK